MLVCCSAFSPLFFVFFTSFDPRNSFYFVRKLGADFFPFFTYYAAKIFPRHKSIADGLHSALIILFQTLCWFFLFFFTCYAAKIFRCHDENCRWCSSPEIMAAPAASSPRMWETSWRSCLLRWKPSRALTSPRDCRGKFAKKKKDKKKEEKYISFAVPTFEN